MSELAATLLASFIPAVGVGGVVFLIALLIPEKIEKWSALIWRLLSTLGSLFKFAHKKYVKHDLQGRINEFVKRLRHDVPNLPEEKLKIEWVDTKQTRQSLLQDGRVVLRLKRNDPQEHNFVHGSYLYVSTALLGKAKRYLSKSQRESLDLFVCSKIIEEEKPAVINFFLDEYLHPAANRGGDKFVAYLDDYALIDNGGYFFPVFVQEMNYLGDKVFGTRLTVPIIQEVNAVITFLKTVVRRKIGEEIDLNFEGRYCHFGIVLIGKRAKLLTSTEPYVKYITSLQNRRKQTIYLLSRKEAEKKLIEIAGNFEDTYHSAASVHFDAPLRYQDGHEQTARMCCLVLRRRAVSVVAVPEAG